MLMKNFKTVCLLVLISTLLLANHQEFEEFHRRFLSSRALRNEEGLLSLMRDLESHLPTVTNPHVIEFKLLLAECHMEYGNLIEENKQKRFHFERALALSQEAMKLQPENGKAYYIAAFSISRLIEFVNVFQKLSLLSSFDSYMSKAVQYLTDDVYKGLAYMGLAIRYMSPPWPLNDYSKSEKFFEESKKYIGDYSALYLNWGYLYLKMNDRKKALEMFQRAIDSKPNELFLKAHEESVLIAKEEIKKLGK